MSIIEILAVVGIIGYVIFKQVRGEALRGKRAVLLPAILTVVGFTDLHGNGGTHLTHADVACLVIGAAGSALIGLAFGAITRLEERDGFLWAQLPMRGLWLWGALVGWRVAVMALAVTMHANVAASSATLLFSLGINRLAQAAVIVPRAMAMGVPFAPEKDGKSFMAGTIENGFGSRASTRTSTFACASTSNSASSHNLNRDHSHSHSHNRNRNRNFGHTDSRTDSYTFPRTDDDRFSSWDR
jgi:hypothetical protein